MLRGQSRIDSSYSEHSLGKDFTADLDRVACALPPVGHDRRNPDFVWLWKRVLVEQGLFRTSSPAANSDEPLFQLLHRQTETVFDLFIVLRPESSPFGRNILDCRAQLPHLPHLFADISADVCLHAVDELQEVALVTKPA